MSDAGAESNLEFDTAYLRVKADQAVKRDTPHWIHVLSMHSEDHHSVIEAIRVLDAVNTDAEEQAAMHQLMQYAPLPVLDAYVRMVERHFDRIREERKQVEAKPWWKRWL